MFSRHSDLPLEKDATSRFLPWLVAPMVFLCAVALAGVFILSGLIGRWDRDVSGTLTVEIAAASGDARESAERTRERVDQAVALLNGFPGVANARALTQDQLVALLAPWLGNSELLRELPLPALIDVTTRAESPPDLIALTAKLAQTVEGASLDDHRVWLSRLIRLSRSIEWLAIAIVMLIGGVTSATVFYATRTGMAIHQEVIEVLHLIGAPDDYIARQFADRAFVLALKGGVVGLALTVPVLMLIGMTARRLEGGFLAELSLPILGWLSVLVLPAVAALLAMLTARMAVHRTLARLL
ncbi:cell division protein FtsX [Telmatospirillum siberiense]|uniref:Cell division protein n=1 Tax=Telmatospirillum siberiense TaxID=382514 RepID=A0A2N3PNM1_9PROT|nr:FtsX-like permease family protein [Telmatospirillum siberiense]PKU22013.1 cell division protein [Telmatospirillum siberiense]